MKKYNTVDEYINSFDKDKKALLNQIRSIVKESFDNLEETISYGMPAYKLNGILFYFAAFKDHIGFFPTSAGVTKFKKELVNYKTSKGTIQFPIDKPLPISLIKRIIKFRIKEDSKKEKK